MARALSQSWVARTILVLALGLAGPAIESGFAQARSRAHSNLNTAIEYYRRGDYEMAARFFDQAKAGQTDLSESERQDLGSYIQRNDAALKARTDGAERLRLAEQAMREGKSPVAESLLREVLANQFVAAADKERAQKLMEQARPRGALPTTMPGASASSDPLVRARAKLQQARALMAKGDFNAAKVLAQEADALGVVYSAGEDSPRKVLDEIAKAGPNPKIDAKTLLVNARLALDAGDFDQAEMLANEAKKHASLWSVGNLNPWADSPAKVLKDVQTARAKNASSTATAKASDKPAVNPNSEAARKLVEQGYQHLEAKNYAKAKDSAEKAKALKPQLEWYDRTPEKLLADVERLSGAAVATKPVTDKPVRTTSTASDPKSLLREGRELLKANKLDEARDSAQRAKAVSSVKWGLWDDSPDKLLKDVDKAQTKQDREDSLRLMVEARKLFEKGDLNGAEAKAYRAERLHGPYTVFEMVDRPQTLLTEIEAARLKQKKASEPVLVKNDKPAKPIDKPAKPIDKPVQVAVNDKPGKPSKPNKPATDDPPAPTWPSKPPPEENFKKEQARVLMAECRLLQKEGRLLEARQRALACQQLGAVLDSKDDRPEYALIELGSQVDKRIANLMQASTDHANAGQTTPARFTEAEACLKEARLLAGAFGLDVVPIDQRMTLIAQAKARVMGAVAQAPDQKAVTPVQAKDETPQQRGRDLLEKARVELRAGRNVTARRLAEEAFSGPYSVQNEAAGVLRSIDAEELNQRQLAANRTFEAGLEAIVRKDYRSASSIFRTIEPNLLRDDFRAKLKDIMLMPEMQPSAVAANDSNPPGAATATDKPTPAPSKPGAGDSYAEQVKAMMEVKFQQMREDGIKAQASATERFQAGDTDRALEMLEEFKTRLKEGGLEADKLALLERPIDARLQQFKLLKAQRDAERDRTNRRDSAMARVDKNARAEEAKQKEVARLMKEYNGLLKEGKYKEALAMAMKAQDLDPDNPMAGAAVFSAEIQVNRMNFNEIDKRKKDLFVQSMNQSEDPGPAVNSDDPLKFRDDFVTRTKNRNSKGYEFRRRSEKEREIERRLQAPISFEFKNTPLHQVVDTLRDWSGVNVVPNLKALDDLGISMERPVSLKLEGISMQSALNILLKQVDLTYIIKDDALQITTEKDVKGKLTTKVFPVAELVIPVENYVLPNSASLMHVLGRKEGMGLQSPSGVQPYTGRSSLPGGSPVSGVGSSPGGSMSSGSTPSGVLGPAATVNPTKHTIEDVLMNLIKSHVAPQSWDDVGGPGHLEYYPLGMALIVNQTPDVIEQIQELLEALRRLQEVEVAVEVRLITLAEAFFERVGIDFAVNIKTDAHTRSIEQQLVSGVFKPSGFINDFSPKGLTVGFGPAGNLTTDLDIPIRASSFQQAIPPFGGFQNMPGMNGGLSLGLAFLSDIQVFMFMEAAQADRRTNIMQAPKLTMFNGQTATITVSDFQFFVTDVSVVQAGGQIVFIPTNTAIPTGVNLTIQPVVTADRRFVRMNMTPSLTNLASATVPLFPVTTFITPVFEGGAQGQPVPFTQFLQQPTITTVTVSTSVTVPDGGTVLLGGLKTLSEGRNEFGPPVLSKIPYLNRLVKNVGYGKDTQSLMIMVTPRIIISSEEEERQTGVAQPRP